MKTAPYDFGDAVAAYMLATLKEDIAANSDRVLSGKQDDNLVTIFSSLSQQTSELACISYYYAEASEEDLLDGFGQAALAVANMFRQLDLGNSPTARFFWDGVERTVPALSSTSENSLLNSGKIPFGLTMALLSGRHNDLLFLSGLQQQNYTNPFVVEHEFALAYIPCIQALFKGELNDELTQQATALLGQADEVFKSKKPNVQLIKNEHKMFLALCAGFSPGEMSEFIAVYLDGYKKYFDKKSGLANSLVCSQAIAAIVLLSIRGISISPEVDHPYAPKSIIDAAVNRNR